MSRGEFFKYIKSLDEDELRAELTSIYQKVEEVRKHYAMELGKDSDRKKIFDKAKKDIKNLLYIRNLPRRRPRIQKIKNILKELSKISVFKHELADLYLFTAEAQMAYLLRRPNTTKATFNNCRANYEKACDLIDQQSLQLEFKERCQIVASDSDSIYMLEEEINDIYSKYFRT